MSGNHATSIVVGEFRLILIWPVVLRGVPNRGAPQDPLISQWSKWFIQNARWKDAFQNNPDGQPYDDNDITPIPDSYRYEEIVYFHPFVRDFLMGDGGTKKKDLSTRILKRDDVHAVDVVVDPGETPKRFRVERCELHLMKTRVALLAIELMAEGRNLWELQKFQDQFRRIYPPFWKGEQVPGLCVQQVTWLDADDKPLRASDVTTQQQKYRDFTQQGAEPPVCDHWQFFFGPLQPLQSRKQLEEGNAYSLCYQQLTDERIPTMSYFAVPDPSAISEGDADRITFVDAPDDTGKPNSYPYNFMFLEKRRAGHTYDRFSHYGTTYYCSGYGFSMIGKDDPFFRNILKTHFQRHYFLMNLLAHYQRAALLDFSDELSNAIKDLAGEGPHEELNNAKFRKHVEELQMRFLKFRTRAYFPEVSNQLQAQELWLLIFNHLNTKVLFEVVDSTSERLTGVLAENETRQLTRVATKVVPISLALAVASAMLGIIQAIGVKELAMWWSLIGTAVASVGTYNLFFRSAGNKMK
ncbi:MAG: hypothetical protein EBV06_14330 [Planctomycetia bacterium]|nr:hypothetical protein [Planctomycetia bacterium]